MASANGNPYSSTYELYYSQISLVKNFETRDLVPGGNTGNPVKASEL
jgi:hypothetical protein